MLKIIVEKSSKYKANIIKLCQAARIGEYEILDPLSHDINKQFPYVLMLGAIRAPGLKANRIWQTGIPETTMSHADKMSIFKVFKEVSAYLEVVSERTVTQAGDIPPLKTLEEYLNELNGRVVEISLEDNRLLGIYPDGQPLKMDYDIEYHASTIVNLARINELFDVKKIIIKEI